jgi:hypothetical protein
MNDTRYIYGHENSRIVLSKIGMYPNYINKNKFSGLSVITTFTEPFSGDLAQIT